MGRIFLILFTVTMYLSCQENKKEYLCKPCDRPCDELIFTEPGKCPKCKMDLVKKRDLVSKRELILNDMDIQNGSGEILVEGGFQKERTIVVHYYRAKNFTSESRVIYVLPGAGRNGDDYRNAWIEKAEEYNLLVLSPEYSEKHYPEFWNYNLAGMVRDVKLNEERTKAIGFKISEEPNEWLYNDFDRIFDMVKKALHLKTDTYDMFGHSAGGQLLHRLALFKPNSKAHRILASNSGWYTVPVDTRKFPYGLKGCSKSQVNIDFSSDLIIFLGEKDDGNETRGDLRRSPKVDEQGLHRLERGTYFFNEAKKRAIELKSDFNWKLRIVPDVGHDYRAMSTAAADYLFKKNTKGD